MTPCIDGYERGDDNRCVPIEDSGLVIDVDSDSPDPGDDTGEPAPTPGVGIEFDEAVLVPPFEHRNAVWAGVALLDYDNDGWLDIFMPNGLGGTDALYRNMGDGTFEDVAAEAGIASYDENGAAVAGDLDNDGDMDLVVNTVCSTGTYTDDGLPLNDGNKHLYINNGDGTFEEIPFALRINDLTFLDLCATSLTLVDFDEDGFLDLALAHHIDPDVVPPWVFKKTDPQSANTIMFNDGTGNFDEMIHERLSEENYYVSFVLAFMDMNDDGRVDMLQGQGGGPVEVLLQEYGSSIGPVSFAHTEKQMGLWMGLAVADYDGDQDLDVYATNQGLSPYMVGYDNTGTVFYPAPAVINISHSMLLNDDGLLVRTDWPVEADHLLAGDLFDGFSGVYDHWMHPEGLDRYPWAWGAVALDANADGWMDVAFAGNNSSPPMTIIWNEERGAGPGALLLNQEGEGFRDVTWEWGVQNVDDLGRYQDGRGIATGDLNNDGYADLVIANRSYNSSQSDPLAQVAGVPHVFLSHPREGNWLQIDPVGTTSNRDGIGSLIRIDDGTQERLYILGAGGETNSSSERLLTVGVGDATVVNVEVEFPSGLVTSVSDVDVNQRITVEEVLR